MLRLSDLKYLLEEFDYFGYMAVGHNIGPYSRAATYMEPFLTPDLSLDQLTAIIWHGLYQEACICHNVLTNQPYIISPEDAVFIVGDQERFKPAALKLRQLMLGTVPGY
jgi:hypothetical protein